MHSSIPMPPVWSIQHSLREYEKPFAAANRREGGGELLPLSDEDVSDLTNAIVSFWAMVHQKGMAYEAFKEKVVISYTGGDERGAKYAFRCLFWKTLKRFVTRDGSDEDDVVIYELENLAWMFFKSHVLDVVKASGRRS